MTPETFEAITVLAVMLGGGSILLCIAGLIVAIWERLSNKPQAVYLDD